MENHHFQWENPLQMAIFNSVLLVYQRVSTCRYTPPPGGKTWKNRPKPTTSTAQMSTEVVACDIARCAPWASFFGALKGWWEHGGTD